MGTVVTKAIAVADFLPYAKLGKASEAVQRSIAVFLAQLSAVKSAARAKALAQDAIANLCERYTKSSTRATYVSAYRKAVKAYFDEHGIPKGLAVPAQSGKGEVQPHLAEQHIALNYLYAPAADYQAISTQNKVKTAAQRDHLTPFRLETAIAATEKAIQSEDWRELAAGLIMSVQARPSDMLAAGDFKAVSKYRVEFTSQAKKRGATVTGEVWTIIPAVDFVDAFTRLRRAPAVLALKSMALKDIDSGKNSTLNRAINRVFGAAIPAPFGEQTLSAKNLRAAGVNVAYHLYGRDEQSLGRFAELQLLHDNPGTAANYEDFYCTDAEGKRLSEIGLRQDSPLEAKPKSRTKTSMTIDRQLLAELDTFGPGSRSEQLIHIMALARQTEDLQKQLDYQKEQNARLKAAATVETAPASAPESDPIRAIPNAELMGSKKRGAAEERLRRTVEAIQEYNAGRELAEQIAINKGSLRKLAGVNAQTINTWVDDHAAELNQYSEAQGHGYRQNVGQDLSVIKWSEAAYGAYDWPKEYFSGSAGRSR
jgi:hypothetical protein